MAELEKVIKGLECCVLPHDCSDDCPYSNTNSFCTNLLHKNALELLEEQQNLLKEYEKLSQVCFKIEKYLKISDLSILIDRVEEGKVEVLQDDDRPDAMETTIKIRRL